MKTRAGAAAIVLAMLICSRSAPNMVSFLCVEAPKLDREVFPLLFIPNRGQVDAAALFYSRSARFVLWVAADELLFDVSDGHRDRAVSSVRFIHPNRAAEIAPIYALPGRVHSMTGSDPSRWRTGLPIFGGVFYRDLYEKIDLKVYGREGRVEYDWLVRPDGRVEDIVFECRGAGRARIERNGNLTVETEGSPLVHLKPVCYQIIGGERKDVEGQFKEKAGGCYGFEVEAYDPRQTLVIDPVVLTTSSYLGGSDADYGRSIAVDRTGAVYVTGSVRSIDFPTKGALDKTLGGETDVFVAKFTPDARRLVYATYLGGTAKEEPSGLAVDRSGAVYVVGWTQSPDFPVKNAYDRTFNGCCDVFLTKILPSGRALAFSTYLGDTSWDLGYALALTKDGTIVVTGQTSSRSFPTTPNAYDRTYNGGDADAFLAFFAPNGKSLLCSSLLGGALFDAGRAVALDDRKAIYLTGATNSKDFPVKAACDPSYNGGFQDAFLAKFAPGGKTLTYATYLGGDNNDEGMAVAVDGNGAAHVAGYTCSHNFPLRNSFDTFFYYGEGFYTQFVPAGNGLEVSTFLGGSGDDAVSALALDAQGKIYLTGGTSSKDFPTKSPFQKNFGGGEYDAFLVVALPAKRNVIYATFLGGSGYDYGRGLALGKNAVLIAGGTSSAGFPVKAAFDKTYNGGTYDAFLARFSVPVGGTTGPRLDPAGKN